MGVEVAVQELTKSFGRQTIWGDVSLTLPQGEVSALLGPSGTGKSVFLKTLIGLLKPDKGSIFIRDVDIANCSESKLYDTRKLFGVLFQDGALFGSMTLFDNVAFPLREHTRKSEREVRDIVLEKMDMVGLAGAETKLPGEISGGMRKRAGLARALVLEPEIILVDEPDSGLDPVRTTYISQLFLDINAQTDATFLIVTHNINMARTVPDNLGMLFRRELVMFGPREVLLSSEEPVIKQFLNGNMNGPIGMSEEKDAAQMAAEQEMFASGVYSGGEDVFGVPPQMECTPGVPERKAVARRRDRVLSMIHTLPEAAQRAIHEVMEVEREREQRRRDTDRASTFAPAGPTAAVGPTAAAGPTAPTVPTTDPAASDAGAQSAGPAHAAAIGETEVDPEASDGSIGSLSPDGNYRWDGQAWQYVGTHGYAADVSADAGR